MMEERRLKDTVFETSASQSGTPPGPVSPSPVPPMRGDV